MQETPLLKFNVKLVVEK